MNKLADLTPYELEQKLRQSCKDFNLSARKWRDAKKESIKMENEKSSVFATIFRLTEGSSVGGRTQAAKDSDTWKKWLCELTAAQQIELDARVEKDIHKMNWETARALLFDKGSERRTST